MNGVTPDHSTGGCLGIGQRSCSGSHGDAQINQVPPIRQTLIVYGVLALDFRLPSHFWQFVEIADFRVSVSCKDMSRD
jgi:hypothetical protein